MHFPVRYFVIPTLSTGMRIIGQLQITISFIGLDWRVSSTQVTQVCGHLSILLSQMERVDMRAKSLDPPQRAHDDIDSNRSLGSDFKPCWLDNINCARSETD